MYESGISAKTVIDTVISEADIGLCIPTTTYIRWLNQLEQNLYGSVLTFKRSHVAECVNGEIKVTCPPEDLLSVFCGGDELAKTTPDVLPMLANLNFYAVEDGRVITGYPARRFTVFCRARPVLKTEENYSTETVKLPYAFCELAFSKLRGEAYKLANQDAIAAKWLGDYNAMLQDLTLWHRAGRGYGE